jgi:hypothetical protein
VSYFGNTATRDDSLVLLFHGVWHDVVERTSEELDALLDVLRSGLATRVLILPLEILGISGEGPRRRYAARLRVVWEPPFSRCARPDAWLFSAVGEQPVRDRIIDEALARVQDAYRHAAPPLALGPIVLPHGFA